MLSPLSFHSLESVWVRKRALVSAEDFLVLASFFFEKSPAFLLGHRTDFLIPPRTARKFEALLRKRASGIPVAYLTGHKEFYGLDLCVTTATLIPRPETETLVDDVLQTYREDPYKPTLIMDIGTGSGAIALAIRNTISPSAVSVEASDLSRRALCIAKKNAKRLRLSVAFQHGSLFHPFRTTLKDGGTYYLVANLPYLSDALYQSTAPEVRAEPKRALLSANDGLEHSFELLRQVHAALPPRIRLTIWLEISPEQAGRMIQCIPTLFPAASTQTLLDLSGRERILKVSLHSSSLS